MLKGSLSGASDGQVQPLFKVGFQDSYTPSRKEYTSISVVARVHSVDQSAPIILAVTHMANNFISVACVLLLTLTIPVDCRA
jgi:hypothetical protein